MQSKSFSNKKNFCCVSQFAKLWFTPYVSESWEIQIQNKCNPKNNENMYELYNKAV